jgi:hypothetical protein
MTSGDARGRALSLLAATIFVVACGTRLPTPVLGPHPAGSTSYVEVPYPPPAARVEIVPPRPKELDAVWVDGEWTWQGKRWVWQPGGWVSPPAGAYFAPWLVYRLGSGRLLFAEGAWHAAKGEKLPDPVVLEAARNGLHEESTSSSPAPPRVVADPPQDKSPSPEPRLTAPPGATPP